MKKLRCDEAGFRECNWEFIGDSDEDVMRKAREHGQKMHGAQIDDAALRGKIRDA
jgi:predicted small metal-binding protein